MTLTRIIPLPTSYKLFLFPLSLSPLHGSGSTFKSQDIFFLDLLRDGCLVQMGDVGDLQKSLPTFLAHPDRQAYMEKLQKLLVHAAKHGPLDWQGNGGRAELII